MQQMKKILTLLLIIIYIEGVAQDPRLFEDTWYLHGVVIDGQNYIPPSNNEVPFIALDFTPISGFNTAVCDVLDGTVSYGDLQFTFISMEITLLGCVEPENNAFQNIYLNNFYEDNNADPFNYFIIEDDGIMSLIIISISGDEAYYSNQLLANPDLTTSVFEVYPNPTNNFLYLPLELAQQDLLSTIVYDLNGRPIIELKGNLKDNWIDVSKLSSGFYILTLTTKHGQSQSTKFIKI